METGDIAYYNENGALIVDNNRFKMVVAEKL